MNKNNHLLVYKYPLLVTAIAYLYLTIIIACTSKPQPIGADYYEKCDTTTQKTKHPKEITDDLTTVSEQSRNEQQKIEREQQFLKDANTFLNALQQNDFATARQYATKRGLGTLLYINEEQITSYQIKSQTINKKNAVAQVQINGKNAPIRFEFIQTEKHWQLQGINRKDAEK